MLQTDFSEDENTYFMCYNFFLQKIVPIMEKYGRIRQVTYYNIIRRMRFACWITNATDTDNM